MRLEWDVHMVVDYPEDDIEDTCRYVRENGWDDAAIVSMITDTVMGFDEQDYCNWDHDQTMAVVDEIKRRVGSIQLSMFDGEDF